MAITYSLAPNPHWVIIDNFSKLPNGAAIYTYSSLNPSVFKAAFVDAAGTIPYDEPIVGFGNGTMPPIYWAFDSDNPDDTYYIRVYDKVNSPGNNAQFLWDFDGISGANGGGGGGGTIVVASDIENLVVNNAFFRNIGNQTGTPSLPATLTLAPSTHQGFVNDPTNANVIANGPVGPDIVFAKNNTSCSDNIKFTAFTLGSTDLSPNVTPQIYFQYNCTSSASETYKYVQFPISQGVQNLSGKNVAVRFYGRCTSGNNLVRLSFRQFFGSNGGSADVNTALGGSPFALSNAFGATFVQFVIPSVALKTLGTCGNDGLFFQVGLPLNATTSIDFTYPEIYLGAQVPVIEYDSHDQIDSLANTPRTGDIRISVNNFQPYGWVAMNDGTIANGSVGITPPAGVGFARNNVDTFPLYDLLWNLPIAVVPEWEANGITVVVARGASSVADFSANRQLQLTKAAGRVFAGVSVSPSHTIGQFIGAETHTLTRPELPDGLTDTAISGLVNVTAPATFNVIGSGGAGGSGTVANIGGNQPHSIMQPTVYCNVYIKL